MKKAIAIAALFALILFGSLDRSEHTTHRSYNESIAFNSLYVYRKIKRIDIIITTTGYHKPGDFAIERIYVQYGDSHRYRLNWQTQRISYNKSLKLDETWYPQEHKISLGGDIIDWTRTGPLKVYLKVDNGHSEFIIVNTVYSW